MGHSDSESRGGFLDHIHRNADSNGFWPTVGSCADSGSDWIPGWIHHFFGNSIGIRDSAKIRAQGCLALPGTDLRSGWLARGGRMGSGDQDGGEQSVAVSKGYREIGRTKSARLEFALSWASEGQSR